MKFTKKDFEAWLISQPDETKWSYLNNKKCLFASFLTSLGYESVSVAAVDYRIEKLGGYRYIPKYVMDLLKEVRETGDYQVTRFISAKSAKEVWFKNN